VLHCSIICWWETLYLGWVFFLLNIEHLRLARDVIPLPSYSFDKKERPSSIHASSLTTRFTNSLRVTSEFRTKLIAFIFPLPKGYETLSHPESAWAASRSKHFSSSLSEVVLISMTLFPHRHMCRRLLDPAEKQQQYENVCVIC